MRDADRIYFIMKKLTELWAINSDLRFMQLVSLLELHGIDFNSEEPKVLSTILELIEDKNV